MTLYIIRGHIVTAFASAPASSEDELRVRSVEEVEGSGLSAAQMVAIWNALPGAKRLSKFKDRKTAARRLWAAFGNLPVATEPTLPGAPYSMYHGLTHRDGRSFPTRHPNKQETDHIRRRMALLKHECTSSKREGNRLRMAWGEDEIII